MYYSEDNARSTSRAASPVTLRLGALNCSRALASTGIRRIGNIVLLKKPNPLLQAVRSNPILDGTLWVSNQTNVDELSKMARQWRCLISIKISSRAKRAYYLAGARKRARNMYVALCRSQYNGTVEGV
jgi:hypothetical protein